MVSAQSVIGQQNYIQEEEGSILKYRNGKDWKIAAQSTSTGYDCL